MIIRILGEGQFDVDDAHVDELNRLDAAVEVAIAANEEPEFRQALAALLGKVRSEGKPLELDSLEASAALLPPSDVTLAEARDLLKDDGLIPG